jgi:hypothetical protein
MRKTLDYFLKPELHRRPHCRQPPPEPPPRRPPLVARFRRCKWVKQVSRRLDRVGAYGLANGAL